MTSDDVTSVRITSTNHRVKVVAEDRDDVAVTGPARLTIGQDGSATIDDVSSRIEVRIPDGADVIVGTTSARIDVVGRVGRAAVVSESGAINIDQAAQVDARTVSARVTVGHVDGGCRVRTRSGRVEIGGCGDADVSTTSGRISLSDVTGTVKSNCVTGRTTIEMAGAHDVEVETVSGRVTISMPAGVRVHRPEVHGAEADADTFDCTVSARSVSGRVDVESR